MTDIPIPDIHAPGAGRGATNHGLSMVQLLASATSFAIAVYGVLVIGSWAFMSAKAAMAGSTLSTQQINQLGVIRADAWFFAGFFLLCYLAVILALRSRLRGDSTPRLVAAAVLMGTLMPWVAGWIAGRIDHALGRAFGGMTPFWVEMSSSALVTMALVAAGVYLVCRTPLEKRVAA